jgi:integration host factor subunit beta
MTKSELIFKLAKANPQFETHDVEAAVSLIFGRIAGALSNGDRVELRGFGTFSVRRREARIGRNPRTGGRVEVPETKRAFFKAGKLLHARLNQRGLEN